MKQKANSLPVIRLMTAMLMFCVVFAIMPDTGSDVYAASSKVKFASSIKKSVLKKAKKAGAGKKTKIAVAKVSNYTNIYKKASVYSKEVGRLYKAPALMSLKKERP